METNIINTFVPMSHNLLMTNIKFIFYIEEAL